MPTIPVRSKTQYHDCFPPLARLVPTRLDGFPAGEIRDLDHFGEDQFTKSRFDYPKTLLQSQSLVLTPQACIPKGRGGVMILLQKKHGEES